MGSLYNFRFWVLALLFAMLDLDGNAQAPTIKTFSTGSYIINMNNAGGLTTATGALRPYGLVYKLIKDHNVPIQWVINSSKLKDGIDFSHNGIDYKSGAFIVPKEYITTAITNTMVQYLGAAGPEPAGRWQITVSPITVEVYTDLTSVPTWTFDADNGAIAQSFVENAWNQGTPNLVAVTAQMPNVTSSTWLTPNNLTQCVDLYVMPHADPEWTTHKGLYYWATKWKGSFWMGCHAVSALENSYDPDTFANQMNFLTTKRNSKGPNQVANVWADNSLILWGDHGNPSIPFTHRLPADPIAQYIGVTDGAHLNGSERIYAPNYNLDTNIRWRPTTRVIAYDPTSGIAGTSPVRSDLGNAAAVIVYGRAFGNSNYGWVMYEGGHNISGATAANLSAIRAFWNFSLLQTKDKTPTIISLDGIDSVVRGAPYKDTMHVTVSSPINAYPFTYQWFTTPAGFGTFTTKSGVVLGNPSIATSNDTIVFNPPLVDTLTKIAITAKVIDACGRTTLATKILEVLPRPFPPVAVPDTMFVDPGCGSGTQTKNVLANDYDLNRDSFFISTIVSGPINGIASFQPTGNITYTSNDGFSGEDSLFYRVCDVTDSCSVGKVLIFVGLDLFKSIKANNDFITNSMEDHELTINVLDNDSYVNLPYTGGTIRVRSVTINPKRGRVSVNINNTITYIPNVDNILNDTFEYQIENEAGYRSRALVVITFVQENCSAGQYSIIRFVGETNFGSAKDNHLQNTTTNNAGNCATVNVNRGNNANQLTRGILQFNLNATYTTVSGSGFHRPGTTLDSAALIMQNTGCHAAAFHAH